MNNLAVETNKQLRSQALKRKIFVIHNLTYVLRNKNHAAIVVTEWFNV